MRLSLWLLDQILPLFAFLYRPSSSSPLLLAPTPLIPGCFSSFFFNPPSPLSVSSLSVQSLPHSSTSPPKQSNRRYLPPCPASHYVSLFLSLPPIFPPLPRPTSDVSLLADRESSRGCLLHALIIRRPNDT